MESKLLKINFSQCNDVRVNLTEEEFNMLSSSKSTFIRCDENSCDIEESFFEKVNDVFRYKLKKNESKWEIYYSDEDKKVTTFSVDYDKEISAGNNIILLLESPHKNEYQLEQDGQKEKLKPKSPAAGKTGENILNYFSTHVLPILIQLGLRIDDRKKYNVCIVNTVQFQTSLFHIHKRKKIIRELKDKVWKSLYMCSEIKKDLVTRIRRYEPEIILNGCTSNLKKILTADLNKIPNCRCQKYNISHPAFWHQCFGPFNTPAI